MKPLARILLAAASLALFQSAAHADQRMPGGHYTLTGVEVMPIERTKVGKKINDHKSDTLTHWVRFDVHPRFKLVEGSKEKPFKITNPTVGAKCSLTADKGVRFKGSAVPPGANLLLFKKFNGSFFNISMSPLHPLSIQSIHLRDDFTFPPDTYTFTFQWQTATGETFSDTVKVRIDLRAPKRQVP